MNLENKNILIIYQPWGWGNYENTLIYPMLDELKTKGANVELLDLRNPPHFNSLNILHKLGNLYYRNFKKDDNYYFYQEINHFGKYYLKKAIFLKKDSYDYTLVIRPDLYSKTFLSFLRKKSKKMVGYMWDGISDRESNYLLRTRDLFTDIYVFNKEDIDKYKKLRLKFTTNFYYSTASTKQEDNEVELIYIGGIYINRKDLIAYNFFKKITDDFQIITFMDKGYLNDNKLINDSRVEYVYQHIPYLDTLEMVKKGHVILDICREDHKGLSFRFFESISLQKKIITNNKDVVNYDFYNPNNVLIVNFDESDNIEEITDFLSVPYKDLEIKLIEKYYFINWFINLFKS